jgi:hypothetical protein
VIGRSEWEDDGFKSMIAGLEAIRQVKLDSDFRRTAATQCQRSLA